MAKKYANQDDNEPMMVNDDASVYTQGITIPITLPSTGSYSVESLKKELTEFGMKLLRRSNTKSTTTHASWRDIIVSERVKSMSLGPSDLSLDTRSDKELLAEALEEKYR